MTTTKEQVDGIFRHACTSSTQRNLLEKDIIGKRGYGGIISLSRFWDSYCYLKSRATRLTELQLNVHE